MKYSSRMQLAGISFQNFRSYKQHTFLFPKQTTVIVGKNAVGKTSVVEAIALLSNGESFRAEEVNEMIHFDEQIARVKGKVVGEELGVEELLLADDEEPRAKEPENTELEVLLTRGMLDGKKVQSKLYSVNGVRRRKKDFVGKFFTVVFRPEDMRLIEGSPSRRRQYIDTALSVSDREYAASLKTYEDALKRRNKLLFQVREGEVPRSTLSYWTQLVVRHGQVLQEKRRQFFSFFGQVVFPLSFQIEYQPSVMSEARVTEYAEREIAAGHTLIGPHKDDFSVLLHLDHQQLPVATYGSRGQQRLAVLWLKVCELEYLQYTTRQRPLLLLDDILSELDEAHRRDVLSLLQTGQAVVTTIEESTVSEIQVIVPDIEVIRLETMTT